jgi:hypothetical protein
LTISIFQQNTYSQKEIVGKVEFYKSEATKFALFRDTDDRYTKNLNKRKSKVLITQRDSLIEIETDSSGIFKVRVSLNDSIVIKVNEHSPVFNGQFEFTPNNIKDTLRLKISDRELAYRLDSQREPDFQKKYSEEQARLDFKNGNRNLLLMGFDWPTDETTNKRNQVSEKYDVEYIYIFNPSHCKMRIMYRYNKVIRDFLGIKENVW